MDLKQHLLRAMAFSHATWGPTSRTKGVIDHLRKELVEIESARTSSERAYEWVDVVLLGLDGLTRELAYEDGDDRKQDIEKVAEQACAMIGWKQGTNEARTWPDWRTAPADKGIEHDRTIDDLMVCDCFGGCERCRIE